MFGINDLKLSDIFLSQISTEQAAVTNTNCLAKAA